MNTCTVTYKPSTVNAAELTLESYGGVLPSVWLEGGAVIGLWDYWVAPLSVPPTH